jgi:peptidoglycan/xylan/chitin deacetylase (PgdA/CDA1 family)
MATGSALKTAARVAFDKAGALHVARWMNRRGLRILTYHRFSQREPLARQCAHIRAHYAPVSMTQVADWLAQGGRLPDNALAITVDDGYRDFYQVAYPVLREYGIPATVYLVSDFLERSTWLWLDQVRYGFLHGKARRYRMERPGQPPLDFELGTPDTRRAAARAVGEAAKRLPNTERLRLLAGLREALEVELPQDAPPEYEALHWDEVREMAAAGVEFGAHTRRHPVLSRVDSESELAEEIGGSKLQIERRLERPVEHFCYPNGARDDVGPRAVAAVRAACFRTAVTMESGLNHAGADPFQLLRIGVDAGLEEKYFERCAAGFRV